MKAENDRLPEWGARIEVGKVTGGGAAEGWTVLSFDRPGLTAEGLAFAGALSEGDRVYFFTTPLGGMILGKAG